MKNQTLSSKVVRLGTIPKIGSVFCKIELTRKEGELRRLSISGVEGPLQNSDAQGGCGQIEMHLGDGADITPAPGWTPEMIRDFLVLWRRWHLNDMQAGCEHQRATWHPEVEIEIVTYRLTSEALKLQSDLKRACERSLETYGNLSEQEQVIYRLPFETTDPDVMLSGRYKVQQRETKRAGWVYPKDHPSGLLTKPCEICGYKYGTAWLHEEIPDDVVQTIEALPVTDETPAWV